MAKITKAQLELELEDQRREIAELKAELRTATFARDAFYHIIAQMTVWQFMVARCAKQL